MSSDNGQRYGNRMTGDNSRDPISGNARTSSAFPAVRGERPDFRGPGADEGLAAEAEDLEFLEDISRIPTNGRQMNLAAFSGRRPDTDLAMAEHQRHEKELSDRLDREARLAAWDAQKVMVGDIEMTSAEAQAARSRVCENADAYARWAVRRGLIRAGEEDEFKHAARRMVELKEAERENGELSADQKREWEALSRSRVGRAVEEATAAAHLGKTASIEADEPVEHRSHPVGDVDRPVFPTAPPVNSSFANATAGVPVAGATPEPNAPAPTVRRDMQVQPGF